MLYSVFKETFRLVILTIVEVPLKKNRFFYLVNFKERRNKTEGIIKACVNRDVLFAPLLIMFIVDETGTLSRQYVS